MQFPLQKPFFDPEELHEVHQTPTGSNLTLEAGWMAVLFFFLKTCPCWYRKQFRTLSHKKKVNTNIRIWHHLTFWRFNLYSSWGLGGSQLWRSRWKPITLCGAGCGERSWKPPRYTLMSSSYRLFYPFWIVFQCFLPCFSRWVFSAFRLPFLFPQQLNCLGLKSSISGYPKCQKIVPSTKLESDTLWLFISRDRSMNMNMLPSNIPWNFS